MKTLILNGSPRKNGDTVSLINKVLDKLDGEYKIVNAYDSGISPCIDCRYCWSNTGCRKLDGMQEVYNYIQVCDNILIASPIYFSELTGALLNIGSRLQTYFCAKYFRKEELHIKPKRGAVIVVGGGDGAIDKPYDTACCLLHHMNAYDITQVTYSFSTNSKPAIEDEIALAGVNNIIRFFNGG
ncbi:flavodoxin family protein [Anaerocolumna sp. MB42-C2]|uniref:flavodoxin family protein n=1 Tax=Anaerocolumna sp. MB42-C2 TaxID=3070997 RepID=UPI0027DFE828|nr:flavodoxin family protein [Anaerocolumna sp. MB42-C2]WMJ86316.1 flavodoxin family protein [Anaerocolumna sp. MB42-C2]